MLQLLTGAYDCSELSKRFPRGKPRERFERALQRSYRYSSAVSDRFRRSWLEAQTADSTSGKSAMQTSNLYKSSELYKAQCPNRCPCWPTDPACVHSTPVLRPWAAASGIHAPGLALLRHCPFAPALDHPNTRTRIACVNTRTSCRVYHNLSWCHRHAKICRPRPRVWGHQTGAGSPVSGYCSEKNSASGLRDGTLRTSEHRRSQKKVAR